MIITILDNKEINSSLLEEIKSFDSENISPYLNDLFTQKIGIIRDENDEIIAVGLVRTVEEFKLITNKNKSGFEIARAIKEFVKHGIAFCNLHGGNEIYGIITQGEDHYKKLLKRHFGFKEVEHQCLLKLEN